MDEAVDTSDEVIDGGTDDAACELVDEAVADEAGPTQTLSPQVCQGLQTLQRIPTEH